MAFSIEIEKKTQQYIYLLGKAIRLKRNYW